MRMFPSPAAASSLRRQLDDGLTIQSRRSVLKLGLAGLSGLALPGLLTDRAAGQTGTNGKSVILLWLTGGPSHLDMWDFKPAAPPEIRGPFQPIATSLPGVSICEHLPLQAAMLDRFTLIRSVDSSQSNHEPNMVMQTGNLRAEPRTNPEAEKYPAIAAAVSKLRGPRLPGMPPYIAFTASRSHLAGAGYLGMQYDPLVGSAGYLAHEQPFSAFAETHRDYVPGASITERFRLTAGLDQSRLADRTTLREQLDKLRGGLDQLGAMDAWDEFSQQSLEMLLGRRTGEAFDLSQESSAVRERYGSHPWCQQALLARRLVEYGARFVTLSLSPYGASGAWDNHGDSVVYFGIEKGLRPLLPPFDRLLTTLVEDLEERGLSEDVLVIAMGEFGRTPKMEDAGRNHWQPVMSMCLAGGGLRHGQVIGGTDRSGGEIRERPVRPGDLAATLYRYFGVPLDSYYLDHHGRPRMLVEHGVPIAELFA